MADWLRLRTWLLVLAVQAGLGAGGLLMPSGHLAPQERMAGQASGPMSDEGCTGHDAASHFDCSLSCPSGCSALLFDELAEPQPVSVAVVAVAHALGPGVMSRPEPGPPRPPALI